MDIIYRDESIIVCIKPAGVLSTDEPGGLPELLRRELGDEKADVRTVHRLDAQVAGLMVFARTSKAASRLSAQMREHEMGREYLCVVEGRVKDRFTCIDYLKKNEYLNKVEICDADEKGAQLAMLSGECLARKNGTALCAIRLQTGRNHQIRVQMAGISHPVYGDMRYGGALAQKGKLALWAYSLSFSHPVTKERLRFMAYPPEDETPWKAFDVAAAVEIK